MSCDPRINRVRLQTVEVSHSSLGHELELLHMKASEGRDAKAGVAWAGQRQLYFS